MRVRIPLVLAALLAASTLTVTSTPAVGAPMHKCGAQQKNYQGATYKGSYSGTYDGEKFDYPVTVMINNQQAEVRAYSEEIQGFIIRISDFRINRQKNPPRAVFRLPHRSETFGVQARPECVGAYRTPKRLQINEQGRKGPNRVPVTVRGTLTRQR